MKKTSAKRVILILLVIAAATGITLNWFHLTPGNCYTKGMAIGSSVCHQLPSHTFITEGIQFPICARCSGLYLGTFICLLYYALQGKKSGIPRRGFLLLMLLLAFAWAGDGVNSLVSDYMGHPFLYTTTNITRLVSGFGMGLVLGTALVTLFNITVWKDAEKTALLENLWQLGAYILLTAGSGILLIYGNAFIFQTLAYISVATILAVISLLYTIFWVILLRKENTFTRIQDLVFYLLTGFSSALVQITIMSSLRNWLL